MKNSVYIILSIYAIIAVFTIFYFNGTGDAGDSVNHYLYARYAVNHPELFFHHWAKPLYVLLASPFAQFGITGIKIFNTIISLFTIFFTYKIAQLLDVRNAVIVTIIMICCPLYYILTFSGLTEPLFALFIALGIYLSVQQKYLSSCLLISFLPFVRSEGLIIIGVFGIYFLIKKQWKILPLLLSGHLVYSIAGYFVYHDLLWVFNKIPYNSLNSPYGKGTLSHFAEQLLYVVGVPVYFLFWIGLISSTWRSIKKNIMPEEQILVVSAAVLFILAHTLFWYFGIFNSMGLKRVLIGIIPLLALIVLQGFNYITEHITSQKIKRSTQGLLLLYILIFPFTSNPAAIKPQRDLQLNIDQQEAIKSVNFIKNNFPGNYKLTYAHPYLSETLGIDPFDKSKVLPLTNQEINYLGKGDIIIWENSFALTESSITKESLDNDPDLENLYNSQSDDRGREISYSVYRKK